jgi:hypothetical protein
LLFLKDEFGEEEVKRQLKEYANKVMDEYARKFKKNRYRAIVIFYILVK